MLPKKKSLSRIAKSLSLKEQTPPGDDATTGEERNSSSNQLSPDHQHKSSHRMSWHWEEGALAVPLNRLNSLSTGHLRRNSSSSPTNSNLERSHKSPKFASGSLHDNAASHADFDHCESERQVNMRKRMQRMGLSREDNDGTAGAGGGEDTSSSNGGGETPLRVGTRMGNGKGPRRTKSMRVPPVVRVTDHEDQRENRLLIVPSRVPSSSSPISVPLPPRKKASSAANTRNTSLSPPGESPAQRDDRSSSHSNSDYDYDNEEYEDDSGHLVSAYCTPPSTPRPRAYAVNNVNSMLDAKPTKKDSVSKSRSMSNLASCGGGGDQLGGNSSVSASEARVRSFLVGAVGSTSMLGTQELDRCLSDRTVRVFVGTWNMNGNTPPRQLADFLIPQDLDYVPDVLVVNTQESFPERTEWEVRLQDTLGPSHVLFHSCGLGSLHTAVFLRRDLIWYCSVPETDSFNTRPGVQFRTKGAVAAAFLLFGTSFLFVNSHLTAHQDNARDRIKDLRKINAMLSLPKELPIRRAKHLDISDKFDCVFWAGDLNFRLEQSREVVIREVQEHDHGSAILDFDQLNYLRREGLIFRGYSESEITFPPTYKYDVGTRDNFDTSHKQRTPSFTDRILYKHGGYTTVRPLYYDSVGEVTTSDHKPVWGMWEVRLKPGNDSIPLSGGLFNRDVYLEGMKRRAEALKPSIRGKHGANNMCSLQ